MKKISLPILVIAIMMLLTFAVSASVGTVVTAVKTDKAPNLETIDDSWGNPSIVINASSPNTELYNYYCQQSVDIGLITKLEYEAGLESGVKAENYDVELYYLWDDKYLYFGLKTKDDILAGSSLPWEGDGVQMWLQPLTAAESSGVLTSGVNKHHETNPFTGMYDFSWTLDFDDYTTTNKSTTGAQTYVNAATDCDCYVNPDLDGELHCIIRIPLINLGLNPKNNLVGEELATAVLRVSSMGQIGNQAYSGWLSWGKYFNDCSAASLNTVVLSDSAAPAESTPTDTTPADPTNPSAADLSGVSSWALTEVEAAINEGLVPEYIQKDWTSPITRGQVSEMFIRLLEKATGKTVDAIIAEKGATIEEGKFEDTNDANVYAANALGIINGTSSSKFSPNGTLKRAQIAALINRVAKVVGIATEGYTHSFEDITDNYAWVNAELGWPSTVGIINGVSSTRFNPSGDLTTEQAILITYRALGALK